MRRARVRATLGRMGYPRYRDVPPDAPGVYHCVSRCVRRAFLCGEDPVTGRSFDHRRRWLEQRILALAEVFAVAIHAYAVMSNHFHLVVEVDPGAPRQWTDEDVARRWLSLAGSADTLDSPSETRLAGLAAQPERLAVLRERLGSLSWFMRYLKEPIARRANTEDACTGRFWEGRFRTQALLDDPAVLACMVYVDLNPVRAGLAEAPEHGRHTSVRRRARLHRGDPLLQPLAASIPSGLPTLNTTRYLDLVDWTGRSLHPGTTGAIPTEAPPILERLALRPRQWLLQVPATESRYYRAIGRAETLVARAHSAGLRWLRGVGAARTFERSPKPT